MPTPPPYNVAAIIRHGAYEQPRGVPSALLPHPLTDAGRRQAVEAADRVLDDVGRMGWLLDPVIDASSLLRAAETAALLANRLHEISGRRYRVREAEALFERGLGSAANLTVEEIEAVVRRDPRLAPLDPGWKYDASFRLPFPGSESLMDAGARVGAHLIAHMPRIESSPTAKIFVGHGGAFRHAAVVLGVMTVEEARLRSMHHGVPVYLALDAQGRWSHAAGAWKMRRHDPLHVRGD